MDSPGAHCDRVGRDDGGRCDQDLPDGRLWEYMDEYVPAVLGNRAFGYYGIEGEGYHGIFHCNYDLRRNRLYHRKLPADVFVNQGRTEKRNGEGRI